MNGIDYELIVAADENNLPQVSRLLSGGADANATNNLGYTPLIVASLRGNVQIFKELVKHGADIEAKDVLGCTPLHGACCKGHLAIVNELLSPNDSNGATTTILGKRKSRGRADIEAKDSFGNTPLHKASLSNHLPVVKALLAVGVDIRAANFDGALPIHCAANTRSSAVAKYLLQHFYSTARRLPLHELLEDVTWIGDPNSSSAPPLRVALHRNVLGTDDVVEILEYLVDRDPALLRSRDPDGSLPLHVAYRFFQYRSIFGEALSSLCQEFDSSRRLAALPGMRDTRAVSRHYLHLDEAISGFGLPMKYRESMRD
jgi:hypothetical protein